MDQQTTIDFTPPQNDDPLVLATYAQRAYLDYALSVVKGRALPEVADGQKPVQRRILYAMHRMGLAMGAKPVKSARVVGDVLGKFHPHGDTSAYDALVRMAQDFSLRYPLIDGQGNFGSRDGDGAAAYRYTEARLTPVAKLLLDEIDDGTVEFVPNYDGTQQEPRLLPARLPFVLLNGASGIAVGMATEIPSHNLREVASAAVALIRKPNATLAELMADLPGPDFATGAQIISSAAEIRDAYSSGRGSIKVRAKWMFEELARGQWQLVITELPPGTSCAKVLEEVEELVNPKVKVGKKSLSAEQQQLKAQVSALLDAQRDESNKDSPVRLVFEPRSSRVERDELINTLLAHTSMESNVAVNLTMVGNDGKPKQKGLVEILREWCEFRFDTVRRRSEHRLTQVDDRIHILDGRKLILLNIDEVIRIIRTSDEPKDALIQRFKLSDRQADDILEIRLRQLARLEAIKIEDELKKLAEEKRDLEAILGDDKVLRKTVIKEIEADARQFGDARRTLIKQTERASAEVKVLDEPVTVVVSQKGWLRALKGHELDAQGFSFKAGDALYGAYECRSIDNLLVFSSTGRVHTVAVSQLPGGRGDGQPVTSFIDAQGAQPLHYFAGDSAHTLLITTQRGMGFTATVADMLSQKRAGKAFITLDESDVPLKPSLIAEGASAVAALSQSGRLLVFGLDEMKQLANGGRGVIVMDVDVKDHLVQALAITQQGLVVYGTGRSGAAKSEILSARALAAYIGKRARKGKKLDVNFKPSSLSNIPN
jgi:topoisomerase-4 subunit A